MKCAEVMEWMHRYLDHDLSQEEALEMFRHIDNCPSCAEVFDRLTMLSQQLEQLPDVKPPFSLVDSILPQLEELDRGVREEHSVTGSEDPKIVPFTRKGTHGKKPKGTSLATRTGIGAAAAAVILLFAIFKMPDSMPAADMDQALNQAGNEVASKMMTGSTENAAPTAGQDDSGDGAAELFTTEQNDPAALDSGGAELKADITAPAGAADSAAGADSGPALGQEAAPTEASSGKRSSTAPPASSRKGSSDNDSATGDVLKSQMSTAANQDNSAADTAAPEAGAMQDATAVEPGVMGLLPALVASQPSWPAPDGRYAAELAGQQVVIYSLAADSPQEERTALTSLPLEGAWVSGIWSADSSQFTYVTQLQDGTQATKVYTVPAATTPVPPASPAASADSTPAATPDAATSNK